jgi:hypothetical protein
VPACLLSGYDVLLKVTGREDGLPVKVKLGQINPIFTSCNQVNKLSHFCLIRNPATAGYSGCRESEKTGVISVLRA